MIHYIRETCQEIDNNKELCAKVCLSVASRLQQCEYNEGWQFEHLRRLYCTHVRCATVTFF